MKFRKKPVVIEAIQFDGDVAPIMEFVGEAFQFRGPLANDPCIVTLEGPMLMRIGDWIIKGVKGEFYPCKPDIFAATYQPETAQASPSEGERVEQLQGALADLLDVTKECAIFDSDCAKCKAVSKARALVPTEGGADHE